METYSKCKSCNKDIRSFDPWCNECLAELFNIDDKNWKLKEVVKKFLEILNRKDTSDSGKEFSPVTINCCRALWIEEISEILKDMERYSGYAK